MVDYVVELAGVSTQRVNKKKARRGKKGGRLGDSGDVGDVGEGTWKVQLGGMGWPVC